MRSTLPATSRLLLHTLGFHMDIEGRGCRVGYRTLTRETGLAKSTVTAHLLQLEGEWLRVGRSRTSCGDSDVNEYFPAFPDGVVREPDQVVREPDHPVVRQEDHGGPTVGTRVVRPSVHNSTSNSTENSISEVFEYWEGERRRVLGRKSTVAMKATNARLSKVRARLGEGYTTSALKRAVDGCLGNAFNVERGHVDIELICRDQKHVEQYLSWADKEPADGGSTPFGSGAGRIVG